MYSPVGEPNMVLINEGHTTVAIKPECKEGADGLTELCIPQEPDYQMCADMCTKQGPACGNFAFCTGMASGAPPPPFRRCFLKTAHVDFATVAHVSLYPHGGDCSTFKGDGSRLHPSDGEVARNEGNNLASYKEDCSPDPTDLCFQTTPTQADCHAACNSTVACNSFAFCTGKSEIGIPRCYLKTADFGTINHGDKFGFENKGDCSSFYPTEAGTCGEVKNYYKDQKCCGHPTKTLNFNIAQNFD